MFLDIKNIFIFTPSEREDIEIRKSKKKWILVFPGICPDSLELMLPHDHNQWDEEEKFSFATYRMDDT